MKKRSRKTVNKMFANDGSSTLPEQEVSHTLTDILESPGQALHFPHLFQGLRWFSLKTSSRGWAVLPDPLLQQQRCFQSWLW